MHLPRQLSTDDIYPQPVSRRIVIDPEKLIKMKKERQPFKMVRSRFQPDEPEPVLPAFTDVLLPHRKTVESQGSHGYQSNSNIAVVSSLINIEFNQLFRFEQAEDIPLEDFQTVWLTITGEIKFLLSSRKSFHAREGFLFFLSEAMRKHVVEATAEKSTVLLKLNRTSFMENIMPYFSAKNEQLVGWLSRSPFLSRWTRQLVEDVATIFELQRYQRNTTLYLRDDDPQLVYVLKEGIVLLERSVPITHHRAAFEEYEQQHQMNSYNETDNSLIVRKSMLFGLDGVVFKQGRGRLYQCRTMSPCEVYAIRYELFEALLESDIMIDEHPLVKQYLPRQVGSSTNSALGPVNLPTPTPALAERNSLQYSSVLTERKIRNRTPPESQNLRYSIKPIKPISLALKVSHSVDLVKRTNVENIIKHEEKVRKMSIRSPARTRVNRSCMDSTVLDNNPLECSSKSNHPRLQINVPHLPALALKNPVERHIYKALERQNEVMRTVEFMSFKDRVNQRLFGVKKDSKANFCFNIKAYRSIVSSSKVVRNKSKSKAANPQAVANEKATL